MAARYRKIDPRIWGDEKFATLSPEGKLLAVYCLTSPQANRIGLFRFSLAMAKEDLGDTVSDTVFDTVCDTLKWRFDKSSKVLYFPTWWKYNHPDNPKHWQGVLSDLHDVPQSVFLDEFANNVTHISKECRSVFRNGIAYRIGYRMAYQEQEQEQEQEQDSVSVSASEPSEIAESKQIPTRYAAVEAKVALDNRDRLASIRIAPSDPGAGASLLAVESLDRAHVANWFTRHIATKAPLCGPTALDLLLVLCFARRCRMSPRRIQEPLKLFASGMAKGTWLESAEGADEEWTWLVERVDRNELDIITEAVA